MVSYIFESLTTSINKTLQTAIVGCTIKMSNSVGMTSALVIEKKILKCI